MDIPSDAKRSACDTVVNSAVFDGSPRLTTFLRFVVDEALAGRAERLKEYTIATSVFGQKESFDPQTNTIVRVQAGRLRRRLEMYYLTDGRNDAIRISVPKGGYSPSFERQDSAEPVIETASSAGPARPEPAKSDENRVRPRSPSIAVLPLENYGGDPGDQFFADGLTEETIANLARFKDLFVFSRSTTAKLAQDGADIRQLREELGVDFVLEGSIRKSGSAVRVTVQLIDASSDGHVFAESFDRRCTPEDVFEIQDEIAMLVAGRVADRYGPLGRYAARAKRAGQSKNWETYLWIQKFYRYYTTGSPELHLEVREGLEKALESDVESSDGWAALSIILLDEYRFHMNERPALVPLEDALRHALHAVTSDPENAFAYQALAMVYFHHNDFADFEIAADRAIALNPGHADVLADMGHCHCVLGHWDQGLPLIERAIGLSPVHPGWYHFAPAVYQLMQGDLALASKEIKKAQMPGFFWYHAVAVCISAEAGNETEVSSHTEQLLAAYPEFVENASRECQIWSFHDDIVDRLLAGWRKAGLDVS